MTLHACDSFRFARWFSNRNQERIRRRYFGCRDQGRGLPESPFRRKKKRPLHRQEHRPLKSNRWRNSSTCAILLEVDFQSELELPRIECGGGPAVVTTVAGALLEHIHVVDER